MTARLVTHTVDTVRTNADGWIDAPSFVSSWFCTIYGRS